MHILFVRRSIYDSLSCLICDLCSVSEMHKCTSTHSANCQISSSLRFSSGMCVSVWIYVAVAMSTGHLPDPFECITHTLHQHKQNEREKRASTISILVYLETHKLESISSRVSHFECSRVCCSFHSLFFPNLFDTIRTHSMDSMNDDPLRNVLRRARSMWLCKKREGKNIFFVLSHVNSFLHFTWCQE